MNLVAVVLAVVIVVMGDAPSARADAWGASWGRVDGIITPNDPDSSIVWNTDPANWLLHAEAEVHHYHPYHTMDYGADSEVWNPNGDGYVSIGLIQTGDLAKVDFVEAAVDWHGWPTVRVDRTQDVYSFAHDIPNSQSDAAGLGQHDNLFWIQWDGPGDPPASANVTFALAGPWNLEGDSDLDDDWWADILAYAEVYDASAQVLGSDNEYHRLDGPGLLSDSGDFNLAFSLDLAYDTPYNFRFWLSAESHAEAVPEPTAVLLLTIGGLMFCRRRHVTL